MKPGKKAWNITLSPTQLLSLSFATAIVAGTLLLNTPMASSSGSRIGLINAFFTATSAACVTGMVVVDTGTGFSLFGQSVILVLIQVGGLGLMTMSIMVFMLLGKRITLRERLLIQEALNQSVLAGLLRLTRNIFVVTVLVEIIGAVLLSIRFIPLFGWAKGIYYSIFHSVSTFCSAGFDLMGGYSSLDGFAEDVIMNAIIMGLIIIGGVGFPVILDIGKHRAHIRKWSVHTRLVVIVSLLLIIAGAVFILVVEYGNPDTLGMYTTDIKILSSLFLSVSSRTVGINHMNLPCIQVHADNTDDYRGISGVNRERLKDYYFQPCIPHCL